MKTKSLLSAAALSLLLVSCSVNDIDIDSAIPQSEGNGFTLIGECSPGTRTAFGTPGPSSIPFTWAGGDYVYCGTQKSAAIAEAASVAEFRFSKGSATDGTAVIYNMTGESATEARVLSEQDGENLGASGDFGYTTISKGSFTLSHYTTYLWLNPYCSAGDITAKVKSVSISADAAIAGTAEFFTENKCFGEITGGSKSVDIVFSEPKALGSAEPQGVWAAAVILPSTVRNMEISYYFDDASVAVVKVARANGRVLEAGRTYMVSSDIASGDMMDVLTFEDADYRGDGNYICAYDWSSLIDDPQYGGLLLYGDGGMGVYDINDAYCWYDKGNTELFSRLSEGWGAWAFWSGGHAVSNYVSADVERYCDYGSQLTVYKEGVTGLQRAKGGHNGSDNFCIHYGYADNSGYSLTEETLPFIEFHDGISRVIDHMYINTTTYLLKCCVSGNGMTASIGADDWIKIVAKGYNANGEFVNSAEFYLCAGSSISADGKLTLVKEWTKWDLSSLGKVARVTFNMTGSSDNGYGFSQPAYFAYDDVAVRRATTSANAGSSEFEVL